jgi:hypothetical protein
MNVLIGMGIGIVVAYLAYQLGIKLGNGSLGDKVISKWQQHDRDNPRHD